MSAFKKGDLVTRLISSALLPMEVEVVEVKDGIIYCQPSPATNRQLFGKAHKNAWPIEECWKFREDTLGEVDEELGWTGLPGQATGSFLKARES